MDEVWNVASRIEIRAEAGLTVDTTDAPSAGGEDAFVRWSRTIQPEASAGRLNLSFAAATRLCRHDASQYPRFRAAFESVMNALRVRVTVLRG